MGTEPGVVEKRERPDYTNPNEIALRVGHHQPGSSAHGTITAQAAEITRLKSELAKRSWQPMSTAPTDTLVLVRHKLFGVCEATKAGDVEEDAWYHPSKGSIGAVRLNDGNMLAWTVSPGEVPENIGE